MQKQKEVGIEIRGIKIDNMMVTIEGDSPLIVNNWSKKAKQEILDKIMKKAKAQKVAYDPVQSYYGSLYWIGGMPESPTEKDLQKATFGFPAIGIKAAAVSACSHVGNITKVEARGAFHIPGELVPLNGRPKMREDMVRLAGMGNPATVRHRAEFEKWSATIPIRYNANLLSIEQIVHLFNAAGFGVGIGEWRPEKDGQYGMFHVKAK